jgi:hypothetical protein
MSLSDVNSLNVLKSNINNSLDSLINSIGNSGDMPDVISPINLAGNDLINKIKSVKIDNSLAVITTVGNDNIVAGQVLFFHGLNSSIGAGKEIDTLYQWEISDGTLLEGFNIAHMFPAGQYTVKLTVTNSAGLSCTTTKAVKVLLNLRQVIFVSSNGTGDGSSQDSPISYSKLTLKDNISVLFKADDVFQINNALVIRNSNIRFGMYGEGNKPRFVRNSQNVTDIFQVYGSSNVDFEDLAIDCNTPDNYEKNGAARGFYLNGNNISIRNVDFFNVSDAISTEKGQSGLLVENCKTMSNTSIRAYLCWCCGNDFVIIGNKAQNSTREHIIRFGGVERVLIAHNKFANIDRTTVDKQDIAKACLNLQNHNFCYVVNNECNGAVGVGPLGGADGARSSTVSTDRTYNTVIKSNFIANTSLNASAGSSRIRFVNNKIFISQDQGICINPKDPLIPNRTITDIVIDRNSVISSGKAVRCISILGPMKGQITLTNNLYLNPTFETGYWQSSVIYISDNDFGNIVLSKDNVWAKPVKTTWPKPNCVVYMNPNWGVAEGYFDINQWTSLPFVKNDNFTQIPYDTASGKPTVQINAGANW